MGRNIFQSDAPKAKISASRAALRCSSRSRRKGKPFRSSLRRGTHKSNSVSPMIIQFEQDLKDAIRTIPDYPKPGLMFREITTLLGTARAFRRRAVDELVQPRAMHEDAANKGDWVILVDDLIATVRTAEGAVKLLRQLGAG